jgi:hypothetical protein
MEPFEPFVFQERHGKLDLRAISRVDVDKVVQDNDIDTLQCHLANITFSKLEPADLKRHVTAVFHHISCSFP